ncbi:MAG: hypothetical protein WC197_08065 [Candidatus Gastranaerophilaceae bacterium]|jgi:hypothetical protein
MKNILDFYIRQKMRFTRKGFCPENESKEHLFDDSKIKDIAVQKEQEYLEKYNLQTLKNNSTTRNYLENLYVIELLEKFIDIDNSKNSIKIVDIGSRNWFYATGQYNFFKYKNREKEIFLTGIELDAFRVYSSFYSRYDSALYNIRNLENTRYIAGDFLEHVEKYDYMCCFFPFVIQEPLIHWGLPLKYFKPSDIFEHAYKNLNTNGEMLIINQGEEEYIVQQKILKESGIVFEPRGEFESIFIKQEHKIFVSIIKKQGIC